MRVSASCWLGIIVLALGAFSFPARADVTVFAAASLKEAMDAQARTFERGTGEHIVTVYGASHALARQIDAGAPADLFIAADIESMDYLADRRLVDSRIVLLRNRLVLIAPTSSTVELAIAPGFPLASALRNDRLAIGNSDSVPAGRYAKRALQSLGVWEGALPGRKMFVLRSRWWRAGRRRLASSTPPTHSPSDAFG